MERAPDHDTDNRTMSVPLHDRIPTGTLRPLGDDAGMTEFDEFYQWIDRNR